MDYNIMKSRTAFDKDSNGELAELFLQARDYIKVCIGNDVKERHNKNTTSFSSKEGGYCSIRVKDDYICIIWFQGSRLENKYKELEGDGKYARNQKVYTLDSKTREVIRHHVLETLIKLIEHNELKKLKCIHQNRY